MVQSFQQWSPTQSPGAYASIKSLVDDEEGLRILLREHGTERLVRISFKDRLAYQCRDESDLEGEASRSDGLGRGCYYLVEHSEFVARFEKDSVRQYLGIVHFSIVTDADCIDVLALGTPVVEYL